MPDNQNKQIAKLTITVEGENGKTVTRVITGSETIAYILGEAGLLTTDIETLLGINY